MRAHLGLLSLSLLSSVHCAMLSVKSGLHAATYDAIRPYLTRDDLELPLQKSSMLLMRSGSTFEYQNFTILQGDANTLGRQIWTSRSAKQSTAMVKRAFGHNNVRWPNLLWNAVLEPENGQRRIRFCFADKEAYKKLRCVVEEAAARWNDPLAGRSSIYLEITRTICRRNNAGNFHSLWKKQHYVVILYDGSLNGGVASCGLLPDSEPREAGKPRHFIKLNDKAYGDWDKALAAATHELGHLLGLTHEHQRPDAPYYVTLNFPAMRGYDRLKDYLSKNILNWPAGAQISGRITIEQCHQYAELSELPEIKKRWTAYPYIPMSIDANGKDILNDDNRFRPMGAFDRDSVMLYPTDQKDNGVERIYFVPTAQHPETRISWRTHLSSGDLDAIIEMYPLVSGGSGSSGFQVDDTATAFEGMTIVEDD